MSLRRHFCIRFNVSNLLTRAFASLLLLSTLLVTQFANAQSCRAVFPEVASSYSSSGSMSIGVNSRLYDTDTVLDVSISSDNAATSCDTSACSSSGSNSEALSLGSFNYTNSSNNIYTDENRNYYVYQNSYDDMEIKSNSSMSFYQNNTVTRLDTLTGRTNSRLILDGGEYWINHLYLEANSNIEIYANDKVILYVNQVTFGENIDFNTNGENDQLVIVAYNDFTFSQNSKMNGYLFANEALNFTLNNDFSGAFNAKTITIGENAKLYTRISDIDTARFDGTCEQNVTLPDPVHYYSMDMCAVPIGVDAIDDEAGSLDADVEGTIGIEFSAKYCQAANFSGEQSFIDIPDPANGNDLSEGSISLFFKTPDLTHSNYSSAGSMALFSKDHNGTETGGHLTLWVTDSGSLVARQQNASSSHSLYSTSGLITENQWHHVVYTWGASGMRLYLDGNSIAQKSSYTGGLSANSRDMALGANTWQYRATSSSSRKSQLKDFFKGSIDEVKIYDEQLSPSQVSTLEQLPSQACTSCSADPILVAHWGADVCSFDQSQILDVESGIHAIARNGISNSFSSRFCQGLSFNGSQSYATVAHDSRLQIGQGAISLWFKLPDLAHSNNSRDGGNTLFSKDSINFANGDHLDIRVDGLGKIKVRHQEKETSTSSFWETSAIVQEDQWHHLVYSFGPSGAYIYLDGQQVFVQSNYFNGLDTNDETIVFGASSRIASRGSTSTGNYRDFMLGELDQIKMYRNQPSASDVNDWYQEQSPQCTTCSTLMASYTFDQTNSDSSTIEDTSGNNNVGIYGSSVSSALLGDNISCRAIELPTTSGSGSEYYFDTGISPFEIGNQGSISFWYRSKEDWDDGTSRQLFDANKKEGEKYFFLVKKGNGALAFALEDDFDWDLEVTTVAQNFDADTWVHISVQWNLVNNEYSIFVNGEAQSVTLSGSLTNSTMADLNTLVFGDNRTPDYNITPGTLNSASGYIDDIRIYSQVISATQIQEDIDGAEPCEVVDHYLIEHPASALTCDMPNITIKACANESCSTLSTVPSTIVLTPDSFDPSSTLTFTGQTQVTLNNQTAGTFTIGTSSQEPAAVVECSNNCEIEYESAGVQFFNKATGQTNFDNSWFVAEDNFSNVGIKIVGDSGGTCEGLVDGQQDITLTYACVNKPSATYTPTECNVPFAGIALSGGSSQSGTISMTFDANGEADLSAYNFADVGILQLTASATINGAAVQAASVALNMVPSYLALASTPDTLIKAGNALPFSITAYGASDNVLPGYQSNNLQMSVVRSIPNDTDAVDAQFYFDSSNPVTSSLNEVFSDISATFSNGVVTSNSAYFEEIGTYLINVRDNNYLGAQINADALTLGRVVPDYFDVQMTHQPVLQNTCSSSFTYVGESFGYVPGLEPSYTLTAYNSRGQITQNYARALWRLDFDLAALVDRQQLDDRSIYSGVGGQETVVSGISLSGNDIYNGIATFTLSGLSYAYPKIVSPTGNDAAPFAANFDYSLLSEWFTDADGICYKTSQSGVCAGYAIDNIT